VLRREAGEDLGIVHTPPIVRVGDVLSGGGEMFEIYDLIETDAAALEAIVRVRPVPRRQGWTLDSR
jgi:hypothetical protein